MWGVLGIILWVLHLPYVGRMGGLARLWVLVVPFFVSSIQLDKDVEDALLKNPLRDEYIDADCGFRIDCLMEGIYPTDESFGTIISVSPIRKCALKSVLRGEFFQCHTTWRRSRLYIERGQPLYKTLIVDPNDEVITEDNSQDKCPQRLEYRIKTETEGEKLISAGLFCIIPHQPSYRYVRMVHCWGGHCEFTHPATGEQKIMRKRYDFWHIGRDFCVDIFIGLPLIETSDIDSNHLSNAIDLGRDIESTLTLPTYYFSYTLVNKRPQVSVFVSDKNERGFGVRLRELPASPSEYPELFVRVTETVSVSAHSVLRSNSHGCTNDFFSVYKSFVYCHPPDFSSSISAHIELLRKQSIVVREEKNLASKPGLISYGTWDIDTENPEYDTTLEKEPCYIRTSTTVFLIEHSEVCFGGFAQLPQSNWSVTSWLSELSTEIELSWEPLSFDGEFVVEDIYKISPPTKDYFDDDAWEMDFVPLPRLFSAHLSLGMVRYPVQFFVTNAAIVKVRFSETGALMVEGQRRANATINDTHDQASSNIGTIVGNTKNNEVAGLLLPPGETFPIIVLGTVARILDCVVQVTGFRIILVSTHERLPFLMNKVVETLAINYVANPTGDVRQRLKKYLDILRPETALPMFGLVGSNEHYERLLFKFPAARNFLDHLYEFVLDQEAYGFRVENSYKILKRKIQDEKLRVSLRYKMTSREILQEYLRLKLDISLLGDEDQVVVERIFGMVTLNPNANRYFHNCRVYVNKTDSTTPQHTKVQLFQQSRKENPLVVTTHDFKKVALQGIDMTVTALIWNNDARHYNMWRGFFPESASDVVHALDAFYHLISFSIIEEKDFPLLIETLRLMRVLLPPYQALERKMDDVWCPTKKNLLTMPLQKQVMGETLMRLKFANLLCLDSLARTPAFIELQNNLSESLKFVPQVQEWQLAAYHFSSAELVFKVPDFVNAEHPGFVKFLGETLKPILIETVTCIGDGFSFAATLLHLKVACCIVEQEMSETVDKELVARPLPSEAHQDYNALGLIIKLHTDALKEYSRYIQTILPRFFSPFKLLSINFKLKNLLQSVQQSETFQNMVSKIDAYESVEIDKLKPLTSENGNFVLNLNRNIVIYSCA